MRCVDDKSFNGLRHSSLRVLIVIIQIPIFYPRDDLCFNILCELEKFKFFNNFSFFTNFKILYFLIK